jgi:hypothetical protein
MVGTFVTLAAGYAASLLEAPPAERQLEGLTWSRRPAVEE